MTRSPLWPLKSAPSTTSAPWRCTGGVWHRICCAIFSMPVDRVLSSRRVVLPDGIRPAAIHIREGKIEEVSGRFDRTGLDFGDYVIMPGLVDTHVHINEPGRTEWEGFTTATQAAAAGGIRSEE